MNGSSFAEVMARGGVVLADELAEFRRWKTPGVPDEVPAPPPIVTPDDAATQLRELQYGIERILQDRDFVLVRITDPNLLPQYTSTRVDGVLHVQVGTEAADIEIAFGRTAHGEYIIPWSSAMLEDAFERGDAWLIAPEEIHFCATNTYSYGDTKTFIVCTPTGAV
jgi:hypothetical protein